MSETVSLSDAIRDLRNELIEARNAGDGKSLKFEIEDIELELQMVSTIKGKGGAKIGWGILGAEAGIEDSSARTHRLKFKMKLAPDETGNKPFISGTGKAPK